MMISDSGLLFGPPCIVYESVWNCSVESRLSSPLPPFQSAPYAAAYSLPAFQLNNYSVQSPGGWYNLATGQYIFQPHVAAVSTCSLLVYFASHVNCMNVAKNVYILTPIFSGKCWRGLWLFASVCI